MELGNQKRFGSYLRRMREKRRLSLDAVEEISLGLSERVTKSHLSRIENGQAIPSFPRMFSLSQIYDVPVSSLAERFESCLAAEAYPADAAGQPFEDVYERANALNLAGRFDESLALHESLLDRLDELPSRERSGRRVTLTLKRISALMKLGRFISAKELCESLLGHDALSPRNRVMTLQYFAMCCYSMEKFEVAKLAIGESERQLESMTDETTLAASLSVLNGNLQFRCNDYESAAGAYNTSLKRYLALGDEFEVCQSRLNLGFTMLLLGRLEEGKQQVIKALQIADDGGYDRLRAIGLSHMATAAMYARDHEAAEAYCLRSNRLARPREYTDVIFTNCFHLWTLARHQKDSASRASNERTLRTLISRVQACVHGVAEFKKHLGGGDHE